MKKKPVIIVITPVRNEAWVLEAFLTHCSSWADHIIIADQHSTDGSREIATQFPKVTLIDNPCDEWVEFKCRARLLEEASKIEGNKAIFALDADEFLSEGFLSTASWKKIIESTGNEIYCFRWLNLYGDYFHGQIEGGGAEWAAHYTEQTDILSEYLTREKNAVHCQRIPCLDGACCKYTMIEDIRFVHLGNLNHDRMRNKLDFYQVVNLDKNPQKSNPVSMYRAYSSLLNTKVPELDNPVKITTADGRDITPTVRTSDNGQHYIDEIVAIIHREGFKKFKSLCIWDNPYLRTAGICYTPPIIYRLLHWYLNTTRVHTDRLAVRLIDKMLKKIV